MIRRSGLLSIYLLLVFLVLPGPGRPALAAVDTTAKQAILIDLSSNTVLLEKNADELTPPSSMSKLMTAYMVFERLKSGALTLDATFPVSKKAWRMGGSKMFVLVDTKVRIEDLLRGIIVQSGNDASIVVAEGLARNEEAFAEAMTVRAREIGLAQSVFKNSTGWPDPEHLMTAREIARLVRLTIENFPDYYHYYSEKEFQYGGITQTNRNPLIFRNPPSDGLKTGHTVAGGYGLAASAERDGRRLILVVNGLTSPRERARESGRLLDWGFREFASYSLFRGGETVEDAEVWLGQSETVPLVIKGDLKVTLPRRARRKMKVTVAYDGPLAAPLRAGDRVARLVVTAPGVEPIEVPLVAGLAVERRGFFGRVGEAILQLLRRTQ